jgi:hypothetical protein
MTQLKTLAVVVAAVMLSEGVRAGEKPPATSALAARQEQAPKYALPSGQVIRLLSAAREELKEPTFVIEYVTLAGIRNDCALEAEVADVWSAFREQAVASGVKRAFVSPAEPCKPPFTDAVSCLSTSVVYKLNDKGVWEPPKARCAKK